MRPETDTALAALERLTRLAASEGWRDGLNPSQRSALRYLARANRFSRSPSAVTDYLAATKGTVSQTLQALERKGMVARQRDPTDRRSVRYDLTAAGAGVAESDAVLSEALQTLSEKQITRLTKTLGAVLDAVLASRHGRSYGICRSCRHFRKNGGKAAGAAAHLCLRYQARLSKSEAQLICRDHAAR